MSNLNGATIPSPGSTSVATPSKLVSDVLIVAAVSAIAFALEDLANARGWLTVGAEARGASAVIAGALTAIAVVLARGGTLADLGFIRPQRWAAVPFQVAAILVVFVVAQSLLPGLLSTIVPVPEPDLSRYASISGDLGAAIALALILPLAAAVPEEIIYRGFLIGRLSDALPPTRWGAVLVVSIQALVFGAIHFQWGVGGMLMTVIMGFVWGTAYLLCGRNLWIVILAHSAGHVLLAVQLYLATP